MLVNGAGGGLGIHGVQVAHLTGAEVIAVTGSAAQGRHDPAGRRGSRRALSPYGEDFSPQVRALTGGDGVDVAIDNVGSGTFHAVRRSLGRRGRWVFIGQLSGEFVQLNPSAALPQRADGPDRPEHQPPPAAGLPATCPARAGAAASSRCSMPLEHAAEAHRLVEKAGPVGRIVLSPGLDA